MSDDQLPTQPTAYISSDDSIAATNVVNNLGEPSQVTDQAQTKVVDPRHQHRIELMQQLFAHGFHQARTQDIAADVTEYDSEVILLVGQLEELDNLIQAAAPERPLSEINKVDLAILRLTVFESRQKKTPKKVLINEAVELAKEFGTDSSPKFVNAVLGKLLLPQPEVDSTSI